jgi:hypothetical protein
MNHYIGFDGYTIRHLKKRSGMLIMGGCFNCISPDSDEHFPFTRQNSVSLPLHICKPLKTVFSPAGLPAFVKNRFSARRNFPQLSKIIFQACGTSRSSQKPFFKPAELPAALKNHFSARRNFPQIQLSKYV